MEYYRHVTYLVDCGRKPVSNSQGAKQAKFCPRQRVTQRWSPVRTHIAPTIVGSKLLSNAWFKFNLINARSFTYFWQFSVEPSIHSNVPSVTKSTRPIQQCLLSVRPALKLTLMQAVKWTFLMSLMCACLRLINYL